MEWIRIMALIGSVSLLVFLLNVLLRKLLKVEKASSGWFSDRHVNGLHKKVDIAVYMIAMVVFAYLFISGVFTGYSNSFIILAPVLCIAIVEKSLQAFFEWKYSPTPKQSLLSLCEMVVWTAAVVIAIRVDVISLLFT